MQPPDAERLVSRLSEICAKEGVAADAGALHALVSRTDCDIRAALNTLQLLARQQQAAVLLQLPGGAMPTPGKGAGVRGAALGRRGAAGSQPVVRITQKQVGPHNFSTPSFSSILPSFLSFVAAGKPHPHMRCGITEPTNSSGNNGYGS